MTALALRTRRALGGAVHDARTAWTPWHTAAVALVVLAALVPAAAPAWVHVDSMADRFYVALAATGLWVSVGLAGCPRSARARSWRSARSRLRC